MDMYDYAEKFDADYYDQETGYLYLVQEYNRLVSLGIKSARIRVIDWLTGELIGYATKAES